MKKNYQYDPNAAMKLSKPGQQALRDNTLCAEGRLYLEIAAQMPAGFTEPELDEAICGLVELFDGDADMALHALKDGWVEWVVQKE